MTRTMLESRHAMMGPDRQLWSGMLAHLKQHQPTLCRQWFEEIEPLGIDAGTLRLRSRTSIHRDYLRRQCADPFNDAARTVSKHLLSVLFLGPDDPVPACKSATPTPEIKPAARANGAAGPRPISRPEHGHAISGGAAPNAARAGADHAPESIAPKWDLTAPAARSNTDSLVINPDYSFENFMVGPTNRLAHAAAVAVAANPGRSYNPYFVHGGVGLGKTHLLQAICLRIMEHHPDTRIFYTSCEGFITQFMEAVQAGLAIVSTPVGQVEEWVRDGVNGRICRSLDECTRALDDYRRDPALLAAHQAASRAIAQERVFPAGAWIRLFRGE